MISPAWPSAGLGRVDFLDPDPYSGNIEVWANYPQQAPWIKFIDDATPNLIIFDAFTNWVKVPDFIEPLESPLPGMIRDIRKWTGWSQRDLAEVLHTSHTTVRKFETEGRATARSRVAASQVPAIHDLLHRLSYVTRGDSGRLSIAINTPSADGMSAVQHLTNGNFARAYNSALESLRGRRSPMVAPKQGQRLLDATVEMP